MNAKHKNIHDKFDLWCINLEHRTDRREKMRALMNRLGIAQDIKYYTPKLDPRGGRIGCYQSHYHCLTTSTKPYIIIFEDDCQLNDGIENIDIDWTQVLDDIPLGTVSSKNRR